MVIDIIPIIESTTHDTIHFECDRFPDKKELIDFAMKHPDIRKHLGDGAYRAEFQVDRSDGRVVLLIDKSLESTDDEDDEDDEDEDGGDISDFINDPSKASEATIDKNMPKKIEINTKLAMKTSMLMDKFAEMTALFEKMHPNMTSEEGPAVLITSLKKQWDQVCFDIAEKTLSKIIAKKMMRQRPSEDDVESSSPDTTTHENAQKTPTTGEGTLDVKSLFKKYNIDLDSTPEV